jgi:hypothetical protein
LYAVTHPSTDCAQCCLTTVIQGTGAFNIAYGRWLPFVLVQNIYLFIYRNRLIQR